MTTLTNELPVTSTADRISRTATIIVNGKVDDIFPLFGPIREKEWAYGWNPQVIFPTTSLVEEHMIFKTPGHPDEGEEYLWVVSKYQPASFMVGYTVSTSNRVWFIDVACKASGTSTEVTVTYTYTSLNEKGAQLNLLALDGMYATELEDWEAAINHYLKTGQQLH